MFAAGAACGPRAATPLGEALFVVDTDMPVPTFANRLRVDIYTTSGTWYASHDVLVDQVSEWPTSFGVYAPDLNTSRTAIVRLRAYLDGEVRDYRGEGFLPRPAPGSDPFAVAAEPAATDQPRLVIDGVDSTPPSEPLPELAIDQLVEVEVDPGVRGAVRVVLRGGCVGTMADVAGQRTCIDTEGVIAPVIPAPLDPGLTIPSASLVGTFGSPTPCTATPRPPGHAADGTKLYDEEVCVPGGMFLFGTPQTALLANESDMPQRVAIVPPLRVDRYEVTVARWRAAVAAGFVGPTSLIANDGPLPTTDTDINSTTLCTWSTAPQGREDYALTCLDWSTARAFCQWSGGDLPTEVEWEYVAAVSGRPYRTLWPWGGDDTIVPMCTQVVAGRNGLPGAECNPNGLSFGALSVEARADDNGDVSPRLGVVNLGGGVVEWTVDALASLAANCWVGAPIESPACAEPSGQVHTLRGGSWYDDLLSTSVGNRNAGPKGALGAAVGFRCVRGGDAP